MLVLKKISVHDKKMELHRYIGNIQFLRCETDIIVENKFSHIAMRGYYNAFGIYVNSEQKKKLCSYVV